VALLISFMIIRSILIPIKKLSLATKNIRDGKLFSRVEVKTHDEVGNLARSYNGMAERLAEHEQKIRQKQEELKKVNRELEKTNKNYMEMLGFVSHELKNPLASAVMSLYAVKDGYLGQITDNQKKGLERVAKSLDYFQDMIKNYLDLSRLEKGELEVHKKKISLKTEVISTILAGLEKEITQKKIQIEDLVLEQNKIYADRDLLRIVYDNILSNAIKYGNENGKIKLEAEEDKDRMILSVYNEGKGIPQDKIAKLFKKFSRLDSPGCAGKKGTGLGLYICREIIEKHGGKIWAESQEGKWAKFLFSLPKGH
jgi:signal transduction histidine kinase